MPKRIIFQFEDDLDYQIQAIHSTVELFRGLSRHVDGIYRPSRTRKFGEGDPVRNNDMLLAADCWKICVRCSYQMDYLLIMSLLKEIILQLKWRQGQVKLMCIFGQSLNCIGSTDFVNL